MTSPFFRLNLILIDTKKDIRMPGGTKSTFAKEISQLKVLGESCAYLVPIATSSPNVGQDTKFLGFTNKMSIDHVSLEILGENVVKEEQFKKEALEDKIKRQSELLRLSADPNLLYYKCVDENASKPEKSKAGIKRNQLEEVLMPPPPPSLSMKGMKKAVKKPLSDSEERTVPQVKLARTRSSSRLLARTNNTESNVQKNKASPNDNTFKTPVTRGLLRKHLHNIATVTPGPNINAPQTILRRPNPGELAISLSGSPLLVATEQTSSIPQINIPLRDGTVVTVLAKDGLNPADIPAMDPQTLSRLKKLHEFLGKL